ncbi:MmgE/PrpD family protein [Streptomyces sp. NPDC048710]|uniref:MmgE/PrpD family protein n=1 Tax=Streptomyces sp. NPDC048710 TaxID=3365586 RepID=UPI003718532D
MKPTEAMVTNPEGPTDPDGPTGRLATWLAHVTLDDIPDRVRTRARHLLLDGIACALIGAQLPWSRRAVAAVLAMEGTGDVPLIGWGRTTSGPAAALLNGTFIQGFELDDYFARAPLHSASLVVPSLLSTARQSGPVTGGRFLLGAIAGFETGTRVGLALNGPEMLSRGWHSGPVFGTHTAAAASGVLRGLDAAGFEDALGLAATQSGGLMAAQFEAMSKRMQHGFAARNGFYAAGLAAAGYTGIDRVFEREYGGFLSTFGEGHDPDASRIFAGLGEVWHTEGISIKAHAANGALHPAVDAVLALVRDHGFTASDVVRVHVAAPHAIYHHGWWRPERPLTTIGAQMFLGYAVAVALLDGHVRPEQFAPSRIDSDDVWELIDRVDATLDDSFDKEGPEARFSTRVRITLRDGREVERLVRQPHGGPDDPLTNEEIADKYRALTARVMDAGRADAVEAAVLGLEDLDDIAALTDLLAAPVRGALD